MQRWRRRRRWQWGARVLRGTQAVAAARVGVAVAWRQRTVGATRGRDVPERRVPRAIPRPGLWMRTTTYVMRPDLGRVPACLARRLVRDVIACRAIPLIGGGSADECECEDGLEHDLSAGCARDGEEGGVVVA